MRYSIGLSNEVLDTITNNDYLFCEDKVISLVSKYYGTEYEMAYARCFNFQYKINNTITKVGDKIILYYKDTIELLKKYYGISMTKSENNRDNCYEAINEELKYGKPVIVALDNSQKLWVERAESIDMLIYLITWVEPDKVELLDFHDWGKRKIISKDELCNSFLWMVTVDKESAERKLGVKDVLDDLLHDVNINIDDSRNSFDVISKFLNIQNIGYKEQDKKNGDIKDFWNDIKKSALSKEFENENDLLFLPLYGATLILFRTRMLVTNLIYKLFEKTRNARFSKISDDLMECSALWNSFRLLVSRVYHDNSELDGLHSYMLNMLDRVCKLECSIKSDLEEMRDAYTTYGIDRKVLCEASKNIDDIKNEFIFSKRKLENNISFAWIYSDLELDKNVVSTKNGDAVVCLGQTYKVKQPAKEITLYMFAAYSEAMTCTVDLSSAGNTVGQKQVILNGWVENYFDCCQQFLREENMNIFLFRKGNEKVRHIGKLVEVKIKNDTTFDEIVLPCNPLVYVVGIIDK